MVKEMKIVQPLNSKPKSLTKIFVVIQTHGVIFKNCAPFAKCIVHMNDKHIDNADNLDIIMPMYNLI